MPDTLISLDRARAVFAAMIRLSKLLTSEQQHLALENLIQALAKSLQTNGPSLFVEDATENSTHSETEN